jgi:CYTH domain-containing protein
MATEIERKFLLKNDQWRALAGSGTRYRQGYLSTDELCTVRVRSDGRRGFLTIKGQGSGLARPEFEYPVPLADAEQMLGTLCRQPLIEKIRYEIRYASHLWEIDEFHGDNAGLLLAEVELASETQRVEIPDWVGEEVTGDPRYYNACLAQHPYSRW